MAQIAKSYYEEEMELTFFELIYAWSNHLTMDWMNFF